MHFETLSEAIEPLIDDELIDDVLYQFKSGKEATLFCCRGGRRAARAAAKRTRFGREVKSSLWTNSEFETLRTLHRAGARVLPLFEQVLGEIELWLACNVVHADLSAYNLLYDRDRIVAIDFPQACDPRSNANAYTLLARDLDNVCRHFGRYGIQADGGAIVYDLWDRFTRGEL